MARLREPDEVKTKRSVKEPSSYQVRQSQGLPNTKFDRDKLKFDKEKAALTQKNKEEDRAQKERHHKEKLALTSEKADAAQKSREEVAQTKWAADLHKTQQAENVAAFKNFLFEKYGDVIDDKDTRGIPLDIEKRAARYMTDLESGSMTGSDAIKKFKDDFTQEADVKKQYQSLKPELIKVGEAHKGGPLSPEEIASLDKASPEEMAKAVSGFQVKQQAIQAKTAAEQKVAGEKYSAAYPTSQAERDAAVRAGATPPPMIAGDKPRYTADEFGGPGLGGNLPVRKDLNYGEATSAYNDIVDRAVADKGGGFLPAAAGAWLKYMPGARDLVDPNTPLRTGLRKAGEAISGVFGGGGGETQPAPKAPAQPGVPTAEPKIAPEPGAPSTFTRAVTNPLEFAATDIVAPAAGAALKGTDKVFDVAAKGAVAAGEGVANFAKGVGEEFGKQTQTPETSWATPIPGAQPAPAAPAPAPAAAGEVAAPAKPANIFTGLADTVKGIFTASPENAESTQNIWRSLPQTQEPVAPASPAIKRPEDEETRAFPKAM